MKQIKLGLHGGFYPCKYVRKSESDIMDRKAFDVWNGSNFHNYWATWRNVFIWMLKIQKIKI